MNVEEFIKETLLQVVRGVRAARGHAPGIAKTKVETKLMPIEGSAQMAGRNIGEDPETLVEFDLAVSVENKIEAEGKAAFVTVVGISGKGEHSRSEVSRVKFSVPVTLR